MTVTGAIEKVNQAVNSSINLLCQISFMRRGESNRGVFNIKRYDTHPLQSFILLIFSSIQILQLEN